MECWKDHKFSHRNVCNWKGLHPLRFQQLKKPIMINHCFLNKKEPFSVDKFFVSYEKFEKKGDRENFEKFTFIILGVGPDIFVEIWDFGNF